MGGLTEQEKMVAVAKNLEIDGRALAPLMGITESRVSQLFSGAKKKMRARIEQEDRGAVSMSQADYDDIAAKIVAGIDGGQESLAAK